MKPDGKAPVFESYFIGPFKVVLDDQATDQVFLAGAEIHSGVENSADEARTAARAFVDSLENGGTAE